MQVVFYNQRRQGQLIVICQSFPCRRFALYGNEFPNIEHKNILLHNIMHHLYTSRPLIWVGSCDINTMEYCGINKCLIMYPWPQA